MNRLNANLTPEQRRERARRDREWRQSAARRYEDSQREDPDVGKYRDIGVNRERKAREFVRCYGSSERAKWVAGLPSVVSRNRPCVNAHVPPEGDLSGTGRKPDAKWVVPLTDPEHKRLHKVGRATFEAENGGIDLAAEARAVEEAWRERGAAP